MNNKLKKVEEIYSKRRDSFNSLLQKQNKTVNRISNLRLLVFLTGVSAILFLYITENFILAGAVLIAFLFLFIWLVTKHQQMITSRKYTTALCEINEKALKRLKGEWKRFEDTGVEFRNENHSYSGDLDIFGEGSLFQWINTAATFFGRQKLKWILTEPPENIGVIQGRQEAIEELAEKLDWRQHFTAEGMISKEKMHDPHFLIEWASHIDRAFLKTWIKYALALLPAFTLTLLITAIAIQEMSYLPALAALILQFFILKYKGKERERTFKTAEKYKNNLKVYDKMIGSIEEMDFKSENLMTLKKNFLDSKGNAASDQLGKLSKIIDSVTNRFNAFYFVFNLLTLWDYQCIIALEKWKLETGTRLKLWLEAIGEVEALSSLSIIVHDNPEWARPRLVEGRPMLAAKGIGHPLLTDERVCNDLHVENPAGILLITGSNMSGKSTLLRTAGINLVMAYAGVRTCAGSFKCGLMDIYTSMRISDNLEKNVSSFYAEILRIKMIIGAAEQGKQIFFLLDEVFKGTNSLDRHTGAKKLIMKLGRLGVAGLVSTHDLELGELERESENKILNYHFEEYYQNNELHFDYKLRKGISTTRNAMYLMKMAGIEDS